MSIKGVIFDLDGTLLDTLDDITVNANGVLASFGFCSRSKDEYRYLAGQGVYSLLASASGCEDQKLVSSMVDEFKKKYEKNDGLSKPFEGIFDVLKLLDKKAVKKCVLSNKPDALTKLCIQKYFEEYRFDVVVGQQDGVPIKPDAVSALNIADELGLKRSEIIMVGDSKNDILTAKNGGFYSIGVTWGFRDRAELLDNGADAIADSPLELAQLLLIKP